MSVLLPSTPSFTSFNWRVVSRSNRLTPPLGGDTQLILRPGDKLAADIVLPPMRWGDAAARGWGAALMQGARDSVVFDWPQPESGVGTPGTPLINGAGQAGLTLVMDGFTAGYSFKAFQFFSVIVAGRRYLNACAADTVANGGGQISLPLLIPLRISPADNAVVEVAQPKIEGLVDLATDLSGAVGADHIVNFKFSITEQK